MGHRSILADPRRSEMKDTINSRVKHREWFRPFAPAVLNDRASEYFEIPDTDADLSFMTFTVDATPLGTDAAPATIHVDNTARIQTVHQHNNQKYANVIEEFRNLTGVPIVLNTSFNDMGEPIVESPADAVNTFKKTDMDLLVIGNITGRKT